jgi:hypothetical protein
MLPHSALNVVVLLHDRINSAVRLKLNLLHAPVGSPREGTPLPRGKGGSVGPDSALDGMCDHRARTRVTELTGLAGQQ